MAQLFGQQLLDGLALQIGRRFERLVQIRHISAMVFVVMNLHGQLVDVRLQRVKRVRQRGNGECHSFSS